MALLILTYDNIISFTANLITALYNLRRHMDASMTTTFITIGKLVSKVD